MNASPSVLVTGAGPVGLAVAALLARDGWEVTVLEPRTAVTPRDESRAITWMPEGLLLADELGITGQLRQRAVTRRVHEFRRRPGGPAMMALRFDGLAHRHPYSLNLPQHDSEVALEAAALDTGRVVVERGVRISGVGQDAGSVYASGQDAGGRDRTWRASVGVGCDGARSTRTGIADLLGITGRFADYGTDTAVADVLVDRDPGDPGTSYIALDPARPVGGFCFGPRRWRIVYRLNPGETREVMTAPATIAELAGQALPGASITSHLWASAFRLGQGQSRTYHTGRWVLAGDAAHAMGPSAGAGMMVGLLGAWRLARALHATTSIHSDDLTRAFLAYEQGQRSASLAIQRANRLIFRNIAVRGPALGAARNSALSVIGRIAARRMTATDALVGLAPT